MSDDNNGPPAAAGRSAESTLRKELYSYCKSELLSEEGLREIIGRYGLTPNYDARAHVDNYRFFLGVCCNERITEGMIQYLLKYFPEAARATIEEDGRSPLHCVFMNKSATLNIIRLLIDAAPETVRSVTNTPECAGNMPLHFLCCNQKVDEAAAIQILKLLIEKHPDAVRHADNNGFLPLHYASGRRSPDFCRVLIETYPGSEQIRSGGGELPLHLACIKGSLATVESLYRQYPNAINHTASRGHYPIHAAILGIKHRENQEAAAKIVQFLLDCDPDQKQKEFRGKSLLHYVCAMAMEYNDLNIEAVIRAIKVIFDAHPESVRIVNNEGHTPLRFLCCNRQVDSTAAPIQILKFLVDKHPEAVRHANNNGVLPIHIAAAKKSPEFCRVLIEAYPGSERMTDANGLLPLHVACLNGSLGTVKYLYRQYPAAIIHATTLGYHPIHTVILGIQHRDDPSTAVEVVQFLLDCDPNQKLKQLRGRSLLHYACMQQ